MKEPIVKLDGAFLQNFNSLHFFEISRRLFLNDGFSFYILNLREYKYVTHSHLVYIVYIKLCYDKFNCYLKPTLNRSLIKKETRNRSTPINQALHPKVMILLA